MEETESKPNVPTSSLASIDVIYVQSKVQYEEAWQIQSLDAVLGLVGGFVGLIWGTLSFFLGGYETFKLHNSLISAIYPTSPQGRESDEDEDSPNEKTP